LVTALKFVIYQGRHSLSAYSVKDRITVNDELKKICNEAVVAQFKVTNGKPKLAWKDCDTVRQTSAKTVFWPIFESCSSQIAYKSKAL
jgi:hypothetical protein